MSSFDYQFFVIGGDEHVVTLNAAVDLALVPSVVLSQQPIGTVGLGENP